MSKPLSPLTLAVFRSRAFRSCLRDAQSLWDQRCADNLRTLVDTDADLGAPHDATWGLPEIRAYVIQRGGRVQAEPILHQSATQGRAVWHPPVDEVLAYLRRYGIPAVYEPGLMD